MAKVKVVNLKEKTGSVAEQMYNNWYDALIHDEIADILNDPTRMGYLVLLLAYDLGYLQVTDDNKIIFRARMPIVKVGLT
jgi:hypothetical protein